MSGTVWNSIAGPGQAAEARVASALAPQQQARSASAKDATSGDGSQTQTGTGDITSSDFLTLLVSELKNQDPTQPTDPNAYITQLVGVNSLEQLVQIDSGVSSLAGTAGAGSSGS